MWRLPENNIKSKFEFQQSFNYNLICMFHKKKHLSYTFSLLSQGLLNCVRGGAACVYDVHNIFYMCGGRSNIAQPDYGN